TGRDYDYLSAVLFFLTQGLFQGEGVRLIDFVRHIFADPGAGLVQLEGRIFLRHLFHADKNFHAVTGKTSSEYKSALGTWHSAKVREYSGLAECSRRSADSYSVKTTDCTPEISKRLRQRTFLQAIRSSLRSMYERALAKRARSRSSARPDSCLF